MGKSQIKYFSQNPSVSHPRSRFDRSKGAKTTFDAGYLIPIYVDQAIPGDTMTLDLEGLARLATPIKPTMDNLYLESFFFFIPRRLTWTNFQRYMGEQDDPSDSIDYLIPQTTTPDPAGIAVMSLFDYMDIVPGIGPFSFRNDIGRSYNLVWNQWFRDQNLQNSAVVDMDDGPDSITDYILRRRGKRPDYFTTCQLTPQKGPTVLIPGSDYAAPVYGDTRTSATGGHMFQGWNATDSAVQFGSIDKVAAALTTQAGQLWTGLVAGDTMTRLGLGTAAQYTTAGSVYTPPRVDPSGNTENTMNALRMAEAMQVFYERQMRGGSRYIEMNKYQFGVTSPDARLQRAEFLGGGSTRIQMSPVQQTDATAALTPQGNLAGVASAHVRNHGFTRSFTEHGIILGLISVRADLNYQNVFPRWYGVRSRDEEYFPPFANLGDQAVLNMEIYRNNTTTADTIFGYQERFAEYKTALSTITGLFRSNVSGSLDVWHYAVDYDAQPELGDTFIQDDPPIDRTIAVPTQPHFIYDSFMRITHVRPMPAHAAPQLGVRM